VWDHSLVMTTDLTMTVYHLATRTGLRLAQKKELNSVATMGLPMAKTSKALQLDFVMAICLGQSLEAMNLAGYLDSLKENC
jgi:hypothetical protein